MFGTVSEWFYRWLGGIKPSADYPGFKQFVISPFIPKELKFVHCKYHSPFGEIASNWEKTSNENIVFNLKIPQGSSASFILLSNELSNITIEKTDDNKTVSLVENVFNENGILLESGNYTISGKLF
jgi:alpha-L-rhamnosidase